MLGCANFNSKRMFNYFLTFYFKVEQQLMEEFLLETCVEQMLRDEDSDEHIPPDLNIALNAEILGSSSNPGVAQDAASLASRIADLSLASGVSIFRFRSD